MNEQDFQELKKDFTTLAETTYRMMVKWGPDVEDKLSESQKNELEALQNLFDAKFEELDEC